MENGEVQIYKHRLPAYFPSLLLIKTLEKQMRSRMWNGLEWLSLIFRAGARNKFPDRAPPRIKVPDHRNQSEELMDFYLSGPTEFIGAPLGEVGWGSSYL